MAPLLVHSDCAACSRSSLRAEDFDYDLPQELIALHPLARRDQSRLLVLERAQGRLAHRHFHDLPDYLRAGDVLVLNDSRVIPARLRARLVNGAAALEVLLLEENASNDWWAMLRPGKRAPVGAQMELLDKEKKPAAIIATVREINSQGHRRLAFAGAANISKDLDALGEVPLPPYIRRAKPSEADRHSYQTVYARAPGSVAAPTAGLHFTPELLQTIRDKGVQIGFVTLHVGAGTFAPVKVNCIADHLMHPERFEIGPEVAALLASARLQRASASGPSQASPRVIAVGTTTLRVLESVARDNQGRVVAGHGTTKIFIYPPFQFLVADALVTNFHLPRSTLLMLVSAFAAPGSANGLELILRTYREAIRRRYRLFSYGDAMLLHG